MIAKMSSVDINGKSFAYQRPWDGRRLPLSPACPYLAFDTETEIVDLSTKIPRLAMAVASSGQTHVVIHADQVAEFILQHADARFIFHHAAFDFWVVEQHLRGRREEEACRKWWNVCRDNHMHDSMLLDALIRLADGQAQKAKSSDKEWLPMRNLAEVGEDYTVLRITKNDPYRERYGEIIGKEWADVEEGFFNYAIKDAIVTYRAYLGMMDKAERLMGESGYDPRLTSKDRHEIFPDAVKRFGFLTEHVQVKGSIALAQLTRTGLNVDSPRVTELEARYRQQLDEIVQSLMRDFPGVLKTNCDGSLQLSDKTQTPRVNQNILRERLVEAAETICANGGTEIEILETPTGKVSTSAKQWATYSDRHPLIKLWVDREKATKQCEFFSKLQKDVLHPRYTVLLRTGRTSCSNPNVQQMPREGGFRELFVASPGHLLLAIDYGYIELRTLAAICEARYGMSNLAKTIRAGTDPHCFTAAMLSGMTPGEFMALKDTPDGAKKFKQCRQNAKAVNFGVPGGLGAISLVEYARSTYKVEMNLDQATAMRQKLITEVYPELNENDGYLAANDMQILARNLCTADSECWKALDWKGTRDWVTVFCVQKIVRGKAFKKDGTPYKESFVCNVWDALNELNRSGDPRLAELLEDRKGGPELHRLLFSQSVVTLTGRVRGDVEYTQAKNTPFQGLASDGAKLALWELLYRGFRVTGFVHDELLIELPDLGGYVELATCEEVKRIVCESMAQVTGKVPIDAEYTVSRCWSKEAKLLVKGDKVMAWEP
jgi:hypothetical protein